VKLTEEQKKIIAFNKDQKDHVIIFQRMIQRFCELLTEHAIFHDYSKFTDPEEYFAFIESRDSLRGSKDGKDEEYQKHLKSDAIQKHITENQHHPEYWNARNKTMPLVHVISMFFDWASRTKQKGSNMDDFWPFNMEKLVRQQHAQIIVETMKRDFKDWI